jgi:hypothetical protein
VAGSDAGAGPGASAWRMPTGGSEGPRASDVGGSGGPRAGGGSAPAEADEESDTLQTYL